MKSCSQLSQVQTSDISDKKNPGFKGQDLTNMAMTKKSDKTDFSAISHIGQNIPIAMKNGHRPKDQKSVKNDFVENLNVSS